MKIKLDRLDHLVLTVANIENTVRFYNRVLGMEEIIFADNRTALKFGQQKINLHQKGKELTPNATHAQAGSADLCFITNTSIAETIKHLDRSGALGLIISIYFYDPDGNLIELSNYAEDPLG